MISKNKWKIKFFSLNQNLSQEFLNNFVPTTEYMTVNNFCWNVRDAINILFETDLKEKQNLSKKEKRSLNVLIKNRNVKIWINDTDKNLGPISADKSDVIKECQRRLYNIITYNKVTWEQAKQFIEKIKNALRNTVNKHMLKGHVLNSKQNLAILSKIESFSIPHFYIIWKILKILR